MKWASVAVSAALLAAALAPAASGQPSGYPAAAPPPVSQPPPQTCLNSGVCAPPSSTPPPGAGPGYFNPNAYTNPWGYPTYLGPVGGALSGGADLVNAQGQYLMQQQQSRMLQTQADSARLGYRQQLIEQQKWEKAQLPTTQELLQKEQWRKLQSARGNPTSPEVWSGESLNALLTAFQGAEAQGLRAQPVPLTTDVMTHVNFTTGTDSGAGAGMLKEFTSLQWPFAMQDPPYLDAATKVSGLAARAVDEIKGNGRVTAATFRELDASLASLRDKVAADQSLSPTDWIESKSFVEDLRGSVQTLRSPDAAQYFQGKYALQAASVDDLVRQMTAKGLRFAPAAQGDQPAYTALQQLMKTYDYRLATLAAR